MWGWVRFLAPFIFMVYTEKDYLMHFGVLGMRWGVRKSRNKSNDVVGSMKKLTSLSPDKQKKEFIKLGRANKNAYNALHNKILEDKEYKKHYDRYKQKYPDGWHSTSPKEYKKNVSDRVKLAVRQGEALKRIGFNEYTLGWLDFGRMTSR